MAIDGTVDFESKKLHVEEEVWRDVAMGDSEVAFANVVGAATDIIKRDGTFLIHAERGILSHIHRLTELEKLVEDINAERVQKGLHPFELR